MRRELSDRTRSVVRADAGLYGYERALHRRGFQWIAGADEAGRGACAGPLVAAAVVLNTPIDGLADSKTLTPAARERLFATIISAAAAYEIVTIPAADIDRLGLHVSNVAALRCAVLGLTVSPDYVLTDGFSVPGLGIPSLAMWKGDQVAACIAAASIVAKVTRDRMMCELAAKYPEYDFSQHKGYATPTHAAALARWGPCPEHRMRYANVMSAWEAMRKSGQGDHQWTQLGNNEDVEETVR